MSHYLGVDTSNYTTSLALYCAEDGGLIQRRRLLTVRPGERGLRQNEAVFQHVKNIPVLMDELFSQSDAVITGIGVSAFPTRREGSYMPCFLVGEAVAASLQAALRVPKTDVSHQEGHVAAAAYGAGLLGWLSRPFLSFHLSGGTTECLLVTPGAGDGIMEIRLIAATSDLNAGQVIDRTGVMLGLPFPAGAALDRLSQKSDRTFRPKPSLKGGAPSLSGIENQVKRMMDEGEAPEDIAKFCLESVAAAALGMAEFALETAGRLPVLFAGGVSASSLLRERVRQNHPDAQFSPPEYSTDNAAGAAVLAALTQRRHKR